MFVPPAPGDSERMAQALRLSARVGRRPWPNPPVGAIVVQDGEVVGRGAHEGAGTAHAEVVALREAGPAARAATLYCTLEPCNHQGRTPPCAPAVAASGVARVVVGIRDPNPRVEGGGIQVLLDAGIAVTLGVCADEALDLIWPFVVTRGFERPFVCLKTAISLDGRFAPASRPGRAPVYLTSEPARRDVHVLRRWSDVVLVGGATFRVDGPRLDTRLVTPDDDCPACEPMAAVATSRVEDVAWPGRRHVVFAPRGERDEHAGPHFGESSASGSVAVVVECDGCEGGLDPVSIVEGVASLGAHTLLVEGGPRLASAFLAAGLVDRWVSFTAPVVLGSGPRWPGFTNARHPVPTPRSPITVPSDGSGTVVIGVGTGCLSWTLTRVARSGPDVKAVWDRLSFDDLRERLAAAGGAVGVRVARGGA